MEITRMMFDASSISASWQYLKEKKIKMKSIEIKEDNFPRDLLICKDHTSISFFHLNTWQIVRVENRAFKKLNLRKVPLEQRLKLEVWWNHMNKHDFDINIVPIFLMLVRFSANWAIYLCEENLLESKTLIQEWYGHKQWGASAQRRMCSCRRIFSDFP